MPERKFLKSVNDGACPRHLFMLYCYSCRPFGARIHVRGPETGCCPVLAVDSRENGRKIKPYGGK